MIPFTSEVYLGLIAQYNAATWPAQIVALVLGLFVLWQAVRPRADAGRAGADRIIPWFLAAAWLWTAVAFHGLRLADLVWAAWVFGALFALQSLLIALAGLRGSLRFAFSLGPAGWAGLGCAILSVVLHPLAGLFGGQDWSSLRPFILAPAPLTLFTFGLLLLAPRAPRHLLVIPVLWSVIAGAVAWELAIPADLLLPAAAAVALGFSFLRPR